MASSNLQVKPLANPLPSIGILDGLVWSNEREWSWLLHIGFALISRQLMLNLTLSRALDIYKSLGYDSHMQFSLNLVGQCVSAVSAWAAVSVTDRLPRRKVLVFGTACCCLMLAANAGFSAKWASCKFPCACLVIH